MRRAGAVKGTRRFAWRQRTLDGSGSLQHNPVTGKGAGTLPRVFCAASSICPNPATIIDVTATKERTADVFPLAAALRFLPETRLWGSDSENQTFIGALGWLSSTTRWGCGYSCDGTASGSSVGRFNTADPYQASAELEVPGSWNRYAYVGGDPINSFDPTGLCDVAIAGITMGTGTSAYFDAFSADKTVAYPYSNDADGAAGFGIFDGIVQVAVQGLGGNSSTIAAIQALASAARDGNAINVTTFSGGAGAFSRAVAWLNENGGSGITSLINNITYVSPGANGDLYNNGTAQVYLGNDSTDALATLMTHTGVSSDRIHTISECGHDFGCIAGRAPEIASRSSGPACSNPREFNQAGRDAYFPFVKYVYNFGKAVYDQFRMLDLSYGRTESVTTKIRFE